MDDLTRARIERMQALEAEGRHDALLAYLQELYAEAEAAPAPARPDYFMTMFQWSLLIEKYPPAAAALAAARDEQVRRLLQGEPYTGTAAPLEDRREMFGRVERIALIVEMNEKLGDPRATYVLFQQLEARQPALARDYGWRVLPAVVEVGDFVMADRLRGDPLELLEPVKRAAREFPLFPPQGKAPRLSAELSNLAREVRIGIAVLRGFGRVAQADALRAQLSAGLEGELRTMAERELEDPGYITRSIVEHQMALEDAR
jgi:hypothetical protein